MNEIEAWLYGRGVHTPMRVYLEQTRGAVVAAEPVTGIFGVGANGSDAVEDLREALHDHHGILSSAQRLSGPLEDSLAFLEAHMTHLV